MSLPKRVLALCATLTTLIALSLLFSNVTSASELGQPSSFCMLLGGTQDGATCRIESDATVVGFVDIPVGSTLLILEGSTVTNNGALIFNNGAIVNEGTIANGATGLISNQGTIENWGTFNNAGTLVNANLPFATVVFTNHGVFTNNATFNNNTVFNNLGTAANHGVIASSLAGTPGIIDNHCIGVIEPMGTLTEQVVVNTPGTGPCALPTITIVKDAQPDALRNFRFTGDLGNFKLDDNTLDKDRFSSSETFTVEPGTYSVTEEIPALWVLNNIVCEVDGAPATGTVVDLAAATVSITVTNGDNVTCTFINEHASIVWGAKFHDRNGNGRLDILDLGLSGWEITLTRADGLTFTETTNLLGKVLFWRVPSGVYTLCENLEARQGWFNSLPGDDACYHNVVIEPAQILTAFFGNHNNPALAKRPGYRMAVEPSVQSAVDPEDDAQYDVGAESLASELNQPIQPYFIFLPGLQK